MRCILLVLFLIVQNVYSQDEGINFALNKPTWQSSTTDAGVSSRAVDGYQNPYFAEDSCIQTKFQYEPWWMIDLQQEIYVTSVRITNRMDSCCWKELAKFDVKVGMSSSVGGTANAKCAPTYTYSVAAGVTEVITCLPPVLGRFVSIAIVKDGGRLSFCEVEVYGYRKQKVFHLRLESNGKEAVINSGKKTFFTINGELQYKAYHRGHFVYAYSMITGKLVMHNMFDTMYESSSGTIMSNYIRQLPSEVFVVVLLHYLGHGFYGNAISVLEELCGRPISRKLTWSDSWSLLGYKGELPSPWWRDSVMIKGKLSNFAPAIIETVIPQLVAPTNKTPDLTVVGLTSSTISITWSRPPDILTQEQIPLNYTVCLAEKGGQSPTGCVNNEGSMYYDKTGLKANTAYTITVQPKSVAGIGPQATINVNTLDLGSQKIHVHLVSRIQEDAYYRSVIKPYSSITIKRQLTKFSAHGHHFIVLDAKTGLKLSQRSFNTHENQNAGKDMATFLNFLPNKVIILMVIYYQAHDYYSTSAEILNTICPEAPESYTSKQSWSMVCLKSTGYAPWAESKLSTGSLGPAVVTSNIVLPKELELAPVITKVAAKSPFSVEVSWLNPATDIYTGQLLALQICVQINNVTTSDDCSPLHTANGGLANTVVDNLKPFHQYKVKIRGLVALNYGPYSDEFAFNTTEAEPSSGPVNVDFTSVTSESLIVEWSPPPETDRRGIIREYSICFQEASDQTVCNNTAKVPADRKAYDIISLKPYKWYRFELRAATVVGYGPATTITQRTSAGAPDGTPNNPRVSGINATAASLSWLPPDPDLRNGPITSYQICAHLLDTPDDSCLATMTTADNRTNGTVGGLKPFMTYDFRVSAATDGGLGPSIIVVNKTGQAAPSGPPTTLNVTLVNQTNIAVAWSDPSPTDMNGVMTQYKVCIISPPHDTCKYEEVVTVPQTWYVFDKLMPFVAYNITVSAATSVGFGPPAVITQRTHPAAPSGPPTSTKVLFANQTAITFSWSSPEPLLRNGMIISYKLCLRQFGDKTSCKSAVELFSSQSAEYTFVHLDPVQEYSILISAGTVVGYGPPAFVQKTSGVCNLPVLHSSGPVSNSAFRASGYLDYSYEPYRARLDSEMPWCDRGSRTNAYLQIDLGGKLRILGVSTKGHMRHWRSWVSAYYVMHSMNAMDWTYATVAGQTVLQGNVNDGETAVVNFLDEPVMTRFVRFKIISFVGVNQCMRVEIFGCAPASPVKDPAITSVSSTTITVEWGAMTDDHMNGMINGYEICVKETSSNLTCSDTVSVKRAVTSYEVGNLKPFTAYDVEIAAGTIAGYGNPSVLRAKTNQSAPSGPPSSIVVLDAAEFNITLTWSAPKQHHRNGNITIYTICYQETSLRSTCNGGTNITADQVFYRITDLYPNTDYAIHVRAVNEVGFGPPATVYGTTLSSAPSGPPLSVSVSQLGATALQMSWLPPDPKKRNGRLVGYRVCCEKETGAEECNEHVSLPEQQMTYSVSSLVPNTKYRIHIEAKTLKGHGPPYIGIYRTGQAAPSDPPRNVVVESPNSTSIEMSWEAPEAGKTNGVLTSYEVVVFREDVVSNKIQKLDSWLVPASKTTWSNTKLSENTDYILYLRAGTVKGFGPSVIVHERTVGMASVSSGRVEGKMSGGSIAGGTVLIVVLIAGLILSVLWNKGMLPYTKLYKDKHSKKKRHRRRRRRRKKKRKRRKRRRRQHKEQSDTVELHATESVYSELNDYDAPPLPKVERKRKKKGSIKMATTEDLYGTCDNKKEKIHDTVSHIPGQVIYFSPSTPLSTAGQVTGDVTSAIPSPVTKLDDVRVQLPGLAHQKPINASQSSPLPSQARSHSFVLPTTISQTVSALTVLTPPATNQAVIVHIDTDDVVQEGTSTTPLDITDYDQVTRADIDDVTYSAEIHPWVEMPVTAPGSLESDPRHSIVSMGTSDVGVPRSSNHEAAVGGWCRRTSIPAEEDTVAMNFTTKQQTSLQQERRSRFSNGRLLSITDETPDPDTLQPSNLEAENEVEADRTNSIGSTPMPLPSLIGFDAISSTSFANKPPRTYSHL